MHFKMEESKELLQFCGEQNIQEWLKKVFQSEKIPPFDETPEFFETLKKIMNENESAEKDAKAIMKAEKNMKVFYSEKTEEMQLVTDFIQLNSETCRRVHSLSSVAEKMKLNEPSLSNILLAVTEIEDKEFIKAEKEFVNSHHMSVFSKKVKNAMKMNEKLSRHLKSLAKVVELQKSQNSSIESDIAYFEKKKGNLVKRIEKSNEILHEAGYSEKDKIQHSILVEDAQKLKDLEEQLKTLENKLEAYNSLPANFENTLRAVNLKEKELQSLEEDLQKLLQVFESL